MPLCFITCFYPLTVWLLSLSQAILGAGHYVYADQPEDFNQKVKEICDTVDWAPWRSCGEPAAWHTSSAAIQPVVKSKEHVRARQSSWLYFAHVYEAACTFKPVVPSRRMPFLSPTQRWNIQVSKSNSFNKRLFVPLLYWKNGDFSTEILKITI